jgi:hypothetical protein
MEMNSRGLFRQKRQLTQMRIQLSHSFFQDNPTTQNHGKREGTTNQTTNEEEEINKKRRKMSTLLNIYAQFLSY